MPEKKLSIEIKSKQNYWQILPVYNSTDFKQCFEVETVFMSPPSPKVLFKTFGLNLVELQPGEVKEYKWNIYVINEEPLELQVNTYFSFLFTCKTFLFIFQKTLFIIKKSKL